MTGAPAEDFESYCLQVARGLARLGVPLFVAASRGAGDFYYPDNWQRTVADESVVDRWEPGMALCAVTGVVFDVVDVDPRNDGLVSFQQVHGLLTHTVGRSRTASGGWHDWIMSLGLHKKSNLLPGIDYQGGAPDGQGRGFVFLPPTVRPSKMDQSLQYYRWETAPVIGESGNAGLRELIISSRSGDGTRNTDYTDPELDLLVMSGIPSGADQEPVLRDVAWKLMLAGHGDALISHLWWEVVRNTPQTRPDPWTDADLHRHLDRAREKLGKQLTAAERLALLPGSTPEVEQIPPEMEERIAKEQLRLRVQRVAREREEIAILQRVHTTEGPEVVDGETFIFKEIEGIENFWGDGEVVLWPKDEGLMVTGPQGTGKTTIIQNLLLRRIGIGEGGLYGFDVPVVEDSESLFLYLAMDRPSQARRSIRRMVSDNPVDRGLVGRHLRFWSGPLPINVLDDPAGLLRWATAYCGRVPAAIFCDSYKDLAVGLSKDEVGAALNLAVQAVIASGCQWVGAHHHRKGSQENKQAPRSLDDVFGSTWLTSGLGSVLMLWGQAGDDAVELSQLKEPSEKMNPVRLVHDPMSGWLSVDGEDQGDIDPIEVIRRSGAVGLTARELAQAVRGESRRADVVWAQRQMVKLEAQHMVVKGDLAPSTKVGGAPAQRYRMSQYDLPGSVMPDQMA